MIILEYFQEYPEYSAKDETTCSQCGVTSEDTKLYYIDPIGEIVCGTCIIEYLLKKDYLKKYRGSELINKLSDLFYTAYGEDVDFTDNGDGTYYADDFDEDISEKEAIEILVDSLIDLDFDIKDLETLFPDYTFEETETQYDTFTGRLGIGEGYIREGFDVSDDLQDIWDFVKEQKYDSAATSRNQLAGGVKAVAEILPAGSLNLDYGGGRYDKAVEYLKQFDIMNLVFDPFNRAKEHNRQVLDIIQEAGGADSCTCCNVLNVIDSDAAKITALKNIKRLVKTGGTVYIQTYEGPDKVDVDDEKSGRAKKKPSGVGRETKDGWQENKETLDYLPLVQKVFSDAKYKRISGIPMIVCTA